MALNFSILVVLIICLMITTTTNGKFGPLDEVCAGTLDPPLCIEAVGGDRDASLEGAAEVGFQTAGIDSIGIKNTFNRTATSPGTGPLFKGFSEQCAQLYDHILGIIYPAHEAARVGRWAGVKSIYQVPADVDACEKLFDDYSPVHDDSRKVKVAAQAIYLIAKILSD